VKRPAPSPPTAVLSNPATSPAGSGSRARLRSPQQLFWSLTRSSRPLARRLRPSAPGPSPHRRRPSPAPALWPASVCTTRSGRTVMAP